MVSDAAHGVFARLAFGLVDDADRSPAAGDRLAELVRAHGYRISTGFVGTPAHHRRARLDRPPDVAYRLLLERRCPSWLYPVTMGATTIWERWDSMLPGRLAQPRRDDVVQPLRAGCGRRLDAPRRRRHLAGRARLPPFEIAPILVAAHLRERARSTPATERCRSTGRSTAPTSTLRAVVPPNTRARVVLPGLEPVTVGSGAYEWTTDASAAITDNARPVYSLDSRWLTS